MEKRYQKFAKVGARHITDFNAHAQNNGGEILPYLVVFIDELADLMMVAPDQTERLLTRMAQLARATGIHLVISTQRPSVDVVTGLIKANFPARIAFAVASGTDSRVILDQPGAERLLGRGDMLFQPPDAPAPVRLQGAFLAESEILRIVSHWRAFAGSAEPVHFQSADAPPMGVPLKQMPIWEEIAEIQEESEQDPVFKDAVDLVRRRGRASISMLQRRMGIGYTRAARIIEMMEAKGIVGPSRTGAQHREVLDYGDYAAPPVGE
jgi:S-DNA-T family DNA segregation ATPase FtsK/SpoIIIE